VSVFAIGGSSVGKTINFKCGRTRRAVFIARLHSFNLRIKNRGPQRRRSRYDGPCYARLPIGDWGKGGKLKVQSEGFTTRLFKLRSIGRAVTSGYAAGCSVAASLARQMAA
jgi:hypothetical protein